MALVWGTSPVQVFVDIRLLDWVIKIMGPREYKTTLFSPIGVSSDNMRSSWQEFMAKILFQGLNLGNGFLGLDKHHSPWVDTRHRQHGKLPFIPLLIFSHSLRCFRIERESRVFVAHRSDICLKPAANPLRLTFKIRSQLNFAIINTLILFYN